MTTILSTRMSEIRTMTSADLTPNPEPTQYGTLNVEKAPTSLRERLAAIQAATGKAAVS